MNHNCRLPDSHRLWCRFPTASANWVQSDVATLQPRTGRNQPGLGSSPFARHYLGNHCYFLFLQVLRCFSSLRLPLPHKAVSSCLFQAGGCPIRKPRDITGMCPSPALIAAYRVLRRLSDPRHPPCALAYFAFVTPYLLLSIALPVAEPSALRFVFVTPYVKERLSLCYLVTSKDSSC